MVPSDDPQFAHWLAQFRADETLPDEFSNLVDQLLAPLATAIARRACAHDGLFVFGLCGPQGSGKSTMVRVLARMLEAERLRVAVLSLDDIYLTRTERQSLARDIHPLLATRGPPGTHDVALGCEVIASLAEGRETLLPRFDKALDERRPGSEWPSAAPGVDVLLFEGWCVGAHPEGESRLAVPINELEREEDAGGTWRRYVNRMLTGPYADLFGKLDALALLRAPSFDVITSWRLEQEAKLRAKASQRKVSRVMKPAEVLRFVQGFERTTRQIDREMPARADWVVRLGVHRELVDWSGCAEP